MPVLRVLLVGVVACGVLLVSAPGADAVKAPRTAKACKNLTALQNELDEVDPSDSRAFDAGAFEQIGDAFRQSARNAPKQVKRALRTLGDFYEDLSDADSSVEALQEYGERGEEFSKAIRKFTRFYNRACASKTPATTAPATTAPATTTGS
jgi:hypothetical protein